jgi:RNA polymerase sigma factor (sigma-70 family)
MNADPRPVERPQALRATTLADTTGPLAPTDHALAAACLQGDAGAWAALIDRYKALIYSFPRRYQAPPQDAAHIFHSVCVQLLAALPRLRERGKLRMWIMTAAAHECAEWKRARFAGRGSESDLTGGGALPHSHRMMEEGEREQLVRDAFAQLPVRHQELLRLLFDEDPPVASSRIASGSVAANGSLILAQCLRKLRRLLSAPVQERLRRRLPPQTAAATPTNRGRHGAVEEWVNYIRGVAPAQTSQLLTHHLEQGCERCSQTLELLGRIANITSRDRDGYIPDVVVREAVALFNRTDRESCPCCGRPM